MSDTLTPFQVRLRQRTDQGFKIVELDTQAQRAKLLIRVDRHSRSANPPIVRPHGDTYTCRLIEVDDAGELHDDVVPC